jgi:hypothetical protein
MARTLALAAVSACCVLGHVRSVGPVASSPVNGSLIARTLALAASRSACCVLGQVRSAGAVTSSPVNRVRQLKHPLGLVDARHACVVF